MSDAPTEDRLAIIERIRRLMSEIRSAESPAGIPPGVIEEFAHLSDRLEKIALTSVPSFELAEFSKRLKERQGTKMIDFRSLYEYYNMMDRKLIAGK
jgi:hypothetical protein